MPKFAAMSLIAELQMTRSNDPSTKPQAPGDPLCARSER